MEKYYHVGAWSGELKSDALIVAIVVVAVVGYVAASGRSASKNRSMKNKPVPFRKILQGNVIPSGRKNGKVAKLNYVSLYYVTGCPVKSWHAR